jgi:hypothetical protein
VIVAHLTDVNVSFWHVPSILILTGGLHAALSKNGLWYVRFAFSILFDLQHFLGKLASLMKDGIYSLLLD